MKRLLSITCLLVFCGSGAAQSAAHKKFAWEEFDPAVTIVISTMTAHVRLETEGYTVIRF